LPQTGNVCGVAGFILPLGAALRPLQYGAFLCGAQFSDSAQACSPAMARNMSDDFRRPVPLAFAALAIVGWLLVSYFWSQAADLRTQMDDGLKRAELAREGLAADLQNLQKAAGNAADLDKQAKDAQAALAEAVSARAAAQNELAELTKQISEAKLAVSGAQEEANAKSRDLQSVDAKLQGETDQLNVVEGQITAAQAKYADLDRQIEDATRRLSDLQSQVDALQQAVDAAKAAQEAKPK
jgi:cell division protein FtsL